MSAEEIKRFNEAVNSDEALKEEVKKVGTSLEDLVSLANGKGFDFTLEELKKLAASGEGELSEEELDDVAGGTFVVVKVAALEVVVTTVTVEAE